MIFNFKKLYKYQYQLDLEILKKHHLTFEKTRSSRIIALLVELGEFANENKCFKFWSQNKIINKEDMIEEYIDCLHFFLSLGNYFPKKKEEYNIKPEKDFLSCLLETFYETSKLKKNFTLLQYEKALKNFLRLYSFLKIPEKNIEKYYLKKNKINLKRQENNY